MTRETFEAEIRIAILLLLDMAHKITWNKISDNCRFILSEIKDWAPSDIDEHERIKPENDQKKAVLLDEMMPRLTELYDNFYDINLYIYRSTKSLTIIDIRYYPKSSLNEEYRQKVADKPPMLHCKITPPRWRVSNEEKFDINWPHQPMRNAWKQLGRTEDLKKR